MGYEDLDSWIEKLKDGTRLDEDDVRALCDKAREILVKVIAAGY